MNNWVFFIIAGFAIALSVQASDTSPFTSRIAAIEQSVGGRLGVAALDTGSGRKLEYHAEDRFPLCSTFKIFLAAAMLEKGSLSRRIAFGRTDLLEWSPITKPHSQEGGMTVRDLCAAAMECSDNTAASLLLQDLGGPPKLTEYIRSLGDSVSRIDRTEPMLNSCVPGDHKDTTTPSEMVSDLKFFLLDGRLSRESRSDLETWLANNTTGSKRIRAGLPANCQVGDKTGTGAFGTANDVAIVRQGPRAPILIAIYLTQTTVPKNQLDNAIAKVTALLADELDLVEK